MSPEINDAATSGDQIDSVEILDFPHPKPLPHKEGGA